MSPFFVKPLIVDRETLIDRRKPLIVSQEELDRAVGIIDEVLGKMETDKA
jgi:hypothetical protein